MRCYAALCGVLRNYASFVGVMPCSRKLCRISSKYAAFTEPRDPPYHHHLVALNALDKLKIVSRQYAVFCEVMPFRRVLCGVPRIYAEFTAVMPH